MGRVHVQQAWPEEPAALHVQPAAAAHTSLRQVALAAVVFVVGAAVGAISVFAFKRNEEANNTPSQLSFYIEAKVSLEGVTASQFTATPQVAFRETIAAGMSTCTTKEKVHVHSEIAIGWVV